MNEHAADAGPRWTAEDGGATPACTLAFGPVAIELRSNDRPALDWLAEYLAPWFAPTDEPAAWRVRLWSSRRRYDELARRFPQTARERLCFAFDQETLSLPSFTDGDREIVADLERSCFLACAPRAVDVVGDPDTRRWRFTAIRVVTEIAATRLRRDEIDLHAAAVEGSGEALLIAGPKGAGKTTLSLHLLRSSACRAMANDRVFARLAGSAAQVRGVPTAVKVRTPTLAQFPELERGLGDVERPYLFSSRELAERARVAQPSASRERAAGSDSAAEPSTPAEFALSPAQLLTRLEVGALATAALGAILFPEVRPDRSDWAVLPIGAAEASERLWANLYGNSSGRRPPTLFEQLDGGARFPERGEVDRLARAAPGSRVLLGRDAYRSGALAARLLRALEH